MDVIEKEELKMLAITIISTVILSILLLAIIGVFFTESGDDAGFILAIMVGLAFVIITLWILYVR